MVDYTKAHYCQEHTAGGTSACHLCVATSDLPATTRVKITKARDTWKEVHLLGLHNRRKALAEQIKVLTGLLNLTTQEVQALISPQGKAN